MPHVSEDIYILANVNTKHSQSSVNLRIVLSANLVFLLPSVSSLPPFMHVDQYSATYRGTFCRSSVRVLSEQLSPLSYSASQTPSTWASLNSKLCLFTKGSCQTQCGVPLPVPLPGNSL